MPKMMRKMMDADAKTDANGEDAETVSVKEKIYEVSIAVGQHGLPCAHVGSFSFVIYFDQHG